MLLGLGAMAAAFFVALAFILGREAGRSTDAFIGYLDGTPSMMQQGWVVQYRTDLTPGIVLLRSAMHEGVPQTYAEIQFSYMDKPTSSSCIVPTPPEVVEYLEGLK
jgi:hypothetical protein